MKFILINYFDSVIVFVVVVVAVDVDAVVILLYGI